MQPLDGYFGVNSQLHSGEGMQALYPSYASSVAPGLMMQINRSSELKQPEFFPGSVFNTAPSSREALLGGNSQLLTGKGKEVAYPSNANSVTAGIMAQTSSSFELKQPECSQGSISNIAPSSLENIEGVTGETDRLLLQAKYLLDQADLIFRSLRTNPIYAEKELEAWHQKYFQYKKKAVRFEKSTAIFSVEILESRLRPRVACSMKQSSKDNEGAPSRRAQSLGTKKKTKKRSSSKPRGGRPSVNLDGAQDAGLSSSPTEQRRNTYKPEDNASHEIASMAFQPVELVYKAKIRELAELKPAYQASNYQAFTNADMSSQIPPFSNWSDNIQFGANPTSISLTTASNLPASSASLPQSNRYAAIFESSTSLGHGTNFEDFNYVQGLSCELHTDELLDLFTKIGTPEFLQSSISNAETSSGGASESVLGVNSQLLYGQGSQAIYPSYASSVTAGSTTHKNMSSELKQPEFLQTSIFNMPPNSSQTLDDHFGIDTRLLSGKGMQPLDGYFGVDSQLHSSEGMQALYPSYASSVAPGLMMQINRSSELKQPEFFPGSVFNTAPSSREALLGGNSQLLTGKGKEVAYPSNANSVTAGIMAQTSSSFELKQPECSQGSISNIAPSSLENIEGVTGGNSQLISGEGNQAVYPSNISSFTAGLRISTISSSELEQIASQTAHNSSILQL
ncbi:hypothetical protein J5N97_014646 [Dioscorea zingiberensis]|uniref:Uncharacterized protein n=1 Tax=Dioscorea zingiberensis TaxID=325984 RepID=A0A9D5HK99_9LILI|nr:hypothetical protein J5N97_014646 [Dioscorea zingiberensis]